MRVGFLTADSAGIYSRLARSHDDVKFLVIYDIRTADKFNEMIDVVPVEGSYEKIIKLAQDGSVPVVAMAFLDEVFIKEAAAYGLGVFVGLGKERISDIIYSVGGG